MDNVAKRSRTASIAICGIACALIAVSAQIVIPIGPIPVTMQMFAIPLAICTLSRMEACVTIYAYVALGALGIPIFSGMHGGIGALVGPTGGYLLGYLIAVPVASTVLRMIIPKAGNSASLQVAAYISAGIIFTLIADSLGCIWYAATSGVPLITAAMVTIAPFIVFDMVKVVLAAFCAKGVNGALS